MKKLFTSLFLTLITLTAIAQEATSFSFVCNDKVVTNGSSITCSDYTIDYEIPGYGLGVTFNTNLYIQNNTASSAQAVVKVEAIENCTAVTICCGGTCEPMNNGVAIKGNDGSVVINAGEKLNTDLHDAPTFASKDEIASYTSQFKVSVYPLGNEADCSTITITVSGNTSSIDHIQTGKEAFFSDHQFNYNYAVSAKRALQLYNISGTMVMNRQLDGNNGTVDLTSLPAGIYIYKIAGAQSCGKIVIR